MLPALLVTAVAVACGGGSKKEAPRAAAGAGGGGAAGTSAAGEPGSGTSGDLGASAGHAGASAGRAGSGGASAGAGAAGGSSYATSFDLTEAPISENGVWHHAGLDWTFVDTEGGIAFGTQVLGMNRSGPGAYNDSYAYLSGFAADQRASAVVHQGTIDPGCTHEVEILLRWSDADHVAQGYECNLAYDGSYAQIVRWNGPVGDFTYLGSGSVPGGVHDGDTLAASITGTRITLSVNGVVTATADDASYATGNPGIGFWRGDGGCGALGDYGFTSFVASDAPP